MGPVAVRQPAGRIWSPWKMERERDFTRVATLLLLEFSRNARKRIFWFSRDWLDTRRAAPSLADCSNNDRLQIIPFYASKRSSTRDDPLFFSLFFSTRYSIEGKFNSRGLRYDRERESSDSKLKFIIPFIKDTLFLIVVEQMKFFSNLCVSFRHAISSDGIYRNISNGERICARNFELFSRENNFMEGQREREIS